MHECLAEQMLGSGDIDMGDYANIVTPLFRIMNCLHNFEPMAVEFMMSIPDKISWWSTWFTWLRYRSTNQIRLIDLKTKGNTTSGFYKRERPNGLRYIDCLEKYWKEPYCNW